VRKKIYRMPPQSTKRKGESAAKGECLFVISCGESELREQVRGYVRYALEQRAVVEFGSYNNEEKCLTVKKKKI